MKNSFDFVIIFLVNVIFNLEVNGRVLTRAIIPISPQYITPIKTNHPPAPLPNRPDWPKIILTKHLLELNCLRENYNKYQLNKQQQNSHLHGRKPGKKTFYGKRGNNLADLKLERERENFFKTPKRRRYYGENDKIILTPIRPAGWEFPLYIRGSLPEKEYLPQVTNPQKQPATSQSKINANQHTKNPNGDKWLKDQDNSNPANAINVQTSVTFKEEKLAGNQSPVSSPSLDISKNEQNNQKTNIKEINKVEKNPNYFPVTFRWPTRKPLPNDYKYSKFSKFPEKLQALFAKNVSGPYKWIQTRPQPIRPYEVKEIAEENVQVDVTKDDPSINKGKPQSGVGGGLLTSPISTKVSAKPNADDTLELLQSSISKILQGLMGSKADETIQKQKTHVPKQPSKPQENKKATPFVKTPFPPKKFPIKNPITYSYDLPQRRNFEEGQTNTKQPLLPPGNEPTSNSFTAEEIILDYQKALNNFMSNYVNDRKHSSDQPSGTSFSRNMLFNNSTQTTNAFGRDLKLTNSSPLPDLLTFTTEEQAEPEENDKSQKFTFIPDMTSNYYQHTDEVTLTSSSPYDETITVIDPFIWLKTDQTVTSTPETTVTGSTLFSQPSHPSILDLSESTVFGTTTPLTEAPESHSTSIPQERENVENETEDQTPGTYTTENYKESNDDPLTIDLLPTTKSDTKNQETALKNGRKMNLDVDSDDTELTNSLSSQTGERRSDILIEDALNEYENTKNDISSSNYMSKLKKFMSSSNFTIDDVISIVPSVVDDLRQKKVQSEDVTILSQAFGEYWPDILTLSKDATLDIMLLLKMKNENDLKNILGKYIQTTDFETSTTKIDSVEASEEKANNPPAYDYIDEYKDLYEDMTEQEAGTEKRKRFRPKRENKIHTPHLNAA